MKHILLTVCAALLLHGCTLTVSLTDTPPPPNAEEPPNPFEYSITGNPHSAQAHGWVVYGDSPDGRSLVRRLKAR